MSCAPCRLFGALPRCPLDPTLSHKKRNSYAAAMMDSRLQAGTEGEGAPLMSWKSTIERHTLFLKEWKKESFLFLFNKTYNYMIRSNWLKDKRMECSFVTKPKQASDKYPPRTGQKANINDWKRDKYQTDNLERDKFQRGLRQIPNTNRISVFNFRKFFCRFLQCKRFAMTRALEKQEKKVQEKNLVRF